MTMNKRVAVIGWDSATFDILDSLLAVGALPNLQQLISNGRAGTLHSTIQPITPTAWSSFMTGVNPAKHGIFDFVRLGANGDFSLNSGAHIGYPPIWDYLGSVGKRVLVVNMPMTYPPRTVNGRLLSGMDSPDQNRAYTYPSELAEEIMARFPEYRVGVKGKTVKKVSVEVFTEKYVADLVEMTQMRADLTCHLLAQEMPDFFTTVFIAPDRVQHALGTLLANPISLDDGIGRVYKACDNALGQILGQLDDSWTIFLISDHGACAYHQVFELSTWLVQQGWLSIRPKPHFAKAQEFARKVQRNVARKLGLDVHQRPGLQEFKNRVIWSETKAFSMGAFGNIFINRKGRFPGGVVDDTDYDTVCTQLCAQLRALKDEKGGQPVVKEIYRAREIYNGRFLDIAPDLLIETHQDYFVRNNLDQEEGRIFYPARRYQGRHLAHTGRHTMNGLIVASGPLIKARQERDTANIIDLAPTLLYLFDLPLPADMDGKALTRWLDPTYTANHPVIISAEEATNFDQATDFAYSNEEMEEVTDRLRSLGYME